MKRWSNLLPIDLSLQLLFSRLNSLMLPPSGQTDIEVKSCVYNKSTELWTASKTPVYSLNSSHHSTTDEKTLRRKFFQTTPTTALNCFTHGACNQRNYTTQNNSSQIIDERLCSSRATRPRCPETLTGDADRRRSGSFRLDVAVRLHRNWRYCKCFKPSVALNKYSTQKKQALIWREIFIRGEETCAFSFTPERHFVD